MLLNSLYGSIDGGLITHIKPDRIGIGSNLQRCLDSCSLSRADTFNSGEIHLSGTTEATKILELRQKAMDSLGDRFDIRDFHDVVLKNGAVPLDILERIVDEYIESTQAS